MDGNLVIWRLTDGRPGHERQTEGLAAAIAARRPAEIHAIPVAGRSGLRSIGATLAGRFPGGEDLAPPDLILGAGRACQWPMLAARRASGGRAIYLMRPGLPLACFDLCIIPRHDRPRRSRHVIVSDGPLNPVRRATAPDANAGLMLIGGPSAHHGWDMERLVRDIGRIAGRRADIDWQVADSRRTPPGLAAALAAAAPANVSCLPHAQTGPDWLPAQLARAAYVWVTADSVAMIYEALTAGTRVGIIDVPAKRRDRITAIAADLRQRGHVGDVAGWLEHGRIDARAPAPDEANRCAELVFERWPDLRRAHASR